MKGCVTTNGTISLGDDENVAKLNGGDGCTTLNILKTTEMYSYFKKNTLVKVPKTISRHSLLFIIVMSESEVKVKSLSRA